MTYEQQCDAGFLIAVGGMACGIGAYHYDSIAGAIAALSMFVSGIIVIVTAQP